MKKITLLALLLAAMPTALKAQDCPAVPVPYSLDFESATVPMLPDCTYTGIGFGSQWVTTNNPGNGFTSTTAQYTTVIEGSESSLYTRAVQLTAGTYYKVTYTYGSNVTSSDQSIISTINQNESVTSTIATHTEFTAGTAVSFTSGPLSVSTTGEYYIGITGFSTIGGSTLYIDNIEITEWSCQLPTNVTVSDVTTTGATFSWTAAPDNTSYMYFYWYSTSPNVPSGGPGLPQGVTTVSVTDLLPNTTYYVFTSNQCGPLMSGWTEAVSFTTPLCDVATVPYVLDFESNVTVPEIPACTTVTEFETGMNWRTEANPGHGFDTNVLQYPDSDEPANAWFFTQGIHLEAGTSYRFSYKYGNNSTDTTERLRTILATSPTRPEEGEEPTYLGNHTEITGGTVTEFSYANPLTISVTGTYYFGFNAFSTSEQGSLYVDDIEVNEWSCGLPQNVTVGTITTTTATINWEAQTEPTSLGYFYGFNTTNTPPAATPMAPPGFTASLENLLPDTEYFAFVRTFCGSLMSDWVSVPFTTPAVAGLNNAAFAGFKAYPNPVNDLLTVDNNIAIDKIEIYNVTGQLILQQEVKSRSVQINVAKITSGAYLLNIYAGDSRKNVKFIKQ